MLERIFKKVLKEMRVLEAILKGLLENLLDRF